MARAVEFILAGDVFQVNLAQRLLVPCQHEFRGPVRSGPASTQFGAVCQVFDAGAFQVISASPERFLQVRGDLVETRPIERHERSRISRPEADLFAADDLIRSREDRARTS